MIHNKMLLRNREQDYNKKDREYDLVRKLLICDVAELRRIYFSLVFPVSCSLFLN